MKTDKDRSRILFANILIWTFTWYYLVGSVALYLSTFKRTIVIIATSIVGSFIGFALVMVNLGLRGYLSQIRIMHWSPDSWTSKKLRSVLAIGIIAQQLLVYLIAVLFCLFEWQTSMFTLIEPIGIWSRVLLLTTPIGGSLILLYALMRSWE